MSVKKKPSSRIRTTLLLNLVILAVVLLSIVCHGSSSPTPYSGSGTVIVPDTVKDQATDTCTFERLIGNNEDHLSKGDSCYFRTHTPMAYLNDLQTHPHQQVMVLDASDDWITPDDAEMLMQVIDSDEPAAPVVSPLSSYWPFNQTSTVGNEALFLLEGYRTGYYPPGLCSLNYYGSNKTGMRAWWNKYGKWGLPDEQDAIRIVQNTNPELREYPSDQFPQKTIRTEKDTEGWYIAFIQEGSGVPIISAQCYYVGNDRTTRLTGFVNHSSMIQTQDFSPQMCGCTY